jgi:hypothetical protein
MAAPMSAVSAVFFAVTNHTASLFISIFLAGS